MPKENPTELMRLWGRMGFSLRLQNALSRHYYRWSYPQSGWVPKRSDTTDQFLADAALPFDESPLRFVQGIGVTMYQQIQQAANRVIV